MFKRKPTSQATKDRLYERNYRKVRERCVGQPLAAVNDQVEQVTTLLLRHAMKEPLFRRECQAALDALLDELHQRQPM